LSFCGCKDNASRRQKQIKKCFYYVFLYPISIPIQINESPKLSHHAH